MKKILLLLVMVATGILGKTGMVLAQDAEQYEYEDLIYEIQDGTVKIVGAKDDIISVNIPSFIDNFPVTIIGDEAFYDCLLGSGGIDHPKSLRINHF